MTKAYLGIDIGSISTKGVVIDENRTIIARSYLWTEGNPTEASKNVVRELEAQLAEAGDDFQIVGAGTTGSARRLGYQERDHGPCRGHHLSASGRAHHP